MMVIGYVDYSMVEPTPPEYLAERITIAKIGWNGSFNVIPVISNKHRRFGLVFTRDYPKFYENAAANAKYQAEYQAECEQYFIDELSRERAEMEEEFDEDTSS